MPREKELYRDNLERLDNAFPNKELLNQNEVSSFTGISKNNITKHFTFTKHYISKVKLASALS